MSKPPETKVIENACYEALATIGVRKKYGLGTIPVAEGFLGWIGLNSGRHSDFVRINPNVGVHGISLMEIMNEGAGWNGRPSEDPTYSVALGVLCPDVDQFIFANEDDLALEAARLAQTIEQYALPYMKSMAGYGMLLPELKRSIGFLGGYPQKYAAALFLLGRAPEALDFLTSMESELREKNSVKTADSLAKLSAYLAKKSQIVALK